MIIGMNGWIGPAGDATQAAPSQPPWDHRDDAVRGGDRQQVHDARLDRDEVLAEDEEQQQDRQQDDCAENSRACRARGSSGRRQRRGTTDMVGEAGTRRRPGDDVVAQALYESLGGRILRRAPWRHLGAPPRRRGSRRGGRRRTPRRGRRARRPRVPAPACPAVAGLATTSNGPLIRAEALGVRSYAVRVSCRSQSSRPGRGTRSAAVVGVAEGERRRQAATRPATGGAG